MMKKILFTLMLLLCGMTTVWAGEGNGTKEHPFTGEWEATEFCPNLKKGDYLAFGCVIKGYVTIQDIRLNQKVASVWTAWAPGNLIDDPQSGPYVQYGKDNPTANRKGQSFIVQNVSRNDESQYKEYVISGYYSGFYTTPDADGFVYVESSKQMEIIIKGNENVKGNAQAKIILTQDIYLSDLGAESYTLCNTFSGTLDGDGHTIYGDHYGDYSTERRERTYLFDYTDGATIKNLIFKHIQNNNSDDDYQAIITSQAKNNSVFENITLDNVGLLCPSMRHLGAIAGHADHSTFSNIKVINSDIRGNLWSDYIGIVVGGAVWCTFKNIIASHSNCTGMSHVGGVAGYSNYCKYETILVSNCNFTAEDVIIMFSTNGGDSVGGVTGKAFNDTISNILAIDCNYHAGFSYVGGVAGIASNGSSLSDIQVVNSYIYAEGKSAGGITGQSYNSHYTRCQVDDQTCVYADGMELSCSFAGGIVGFSYQDDIHYCNNSALVGGDLNAIAGIAGFSTYGSIEHCVNTGIVMSLDDWDLEEVNNKYKYKMFEKFPTIRYGDNEYQVQKLDEASKNMIDNDECIGGIAGWVLASRIEGCSNFAPYYTKGKYAGGIVGMDMGEIINCFNAPTGIDGFSGSYEYHGGIVGGTYDTDYKDDAIRDKYDEVPTEIIGCLNLNGDHLFGNEDNITGYSSYCKSSSFGKVVNRVTDEMLASGFVAYSINNNRYNQEHDIQPWRQKLGDMAMAYPLLDSTLNVVDYDYLLSSTPTITTAAQLREFADKVNAGHNPWVASLGADITFPEDYAHHTIGSKDHPFQGLFEGNGHTISGIKYNVYMDSEGVGLFGAVDANTTIRNVTVDGTCQFTNHDGGVAGIVGLVLFGNAPGDVVIENCASHASILANKHAGGILGRIRTGNDEAPNSKVFIRNCYSNSIITAHDGDSGLLCGYTKDHCSINDCWSAGQLRISEGHTTWPYSIVNPKNEGEVFAGYNKEISLQNCYVVNPDDNVDRYGEYKLQEGVEVINQRSFEHGEFTYQLNGNTNDVSKSLRWQQELGVDKAPVPGNKGLYHARVINMDKYGTVCLPYQIKSDEHITYYTFVSDEIEDGTLKLNFEYAETVPAAVPALYLAAEDQTYYFPGAGDDLDYENANCTTRSQTPNSKWMFAGYFSGVVIDDAEVAKSFYYLSNNTIRNAKKITLPPFRAFFHGPSIDKLREMLGNQSGQNARVRIVIDGEENEAAALQLVVDDPVRDPKAKSYTLFGTEAGEGYRGIVVRDGKLHFGCLR